LKNFETIPVIISATGTACISLSINPVNHDFKHSTFLKYKNLLLYRQILLSGDSKHHSEQGPTAFSLPQEALGIHIFVKGHTYSKPHCISLTYTVYLVFNLKMDDSCISQYI
jgi:hypothetical protein